MKHEAERRPIIIEDDIVNPVTLRAADAGVDVRTWHEAMLLAPILHENPLGRALEFLRITGGLGRFLSSTPADFEALGMEEVEVARIHAIPTLAVKLLNHHYQTGDLSTRKQLADHLCRACDQSRWRTEGNLPCWVPVGLDSRLSQTFTTAFDIFSQDLPDIQQSV